MSEQHPSSRDHYLKLLERAIIHFRHRLRCDEQISLNEVHDFLDALHNIPSLLLQDCSAEASILSQRRATIQLDLQAYDEKWVHERSDARRLFLTGLLDSIREEP